MTRVDVQKSSGDRSLPVPTGDGKSDYPKRAFRTVKEATIDMLAVFHPVGSSDKTLLKDPHLVRGICQSLTNAVNYRSVIMEKIRSTLGIQRPKTKFNYTVSKKGKINVKI